MHTLGFLRRLETLGYYALPATHPGSPGRSGLLVVLFRKPTEHLPLAVALSVKDWDGQIHHAMIDATTASASARVVCPGDLTIYGRSEREAVFFTFGGLLEAEAFADETIVTFRSAAPVLERSLIGDREADLFAEEVIGLFARTQAQLVLADDDWQVALLRAGPLPLYLATVQSLLEQLDDSTVLRNLHTELYTTLHDERDWYTRTLDWLPQQRDLATLLAQIS